MTNLNNTNIASNSVSTSANNPKTMGIFMKAACMSVALMMLTSTSAQAGEFSAGLKACYKAAHARFDCGDDVFLPNTPAAACWNNYHSAINMCKIKDRAGLTVVLPQNNFNAHKTTKGSGLALKLSGKAVKHQSKAK